MKSVRDWLLLVLLVADAVVLAVLELFYLPERFDGQVLPNLGGWPFPITALVAGVTTPWLVARAGELSARVLIAGAPLWAWLCTVGVVGAAGPGGDVLLTGDWRTFVLLAAGVLPTAVTLGNRLGRGRAGHGVRSARGDHE